MKITVSIWHIEGSEEKCIVTLYDLASDPFEIGMDLTLDFEEYFPKDIENMKSEGWSQKAIDTYMKKRNELRKRYHYQTVKLKSKSVVLDTKTNNINIDYYIK